MKANERDNHIHDNYTHRTQPRSLALLRQLVNFQQFGKEVFALFIVRLERRVSLDHRHDFLLVVGVPRVQERLLARVNVMVRDVDLQPRGASLLVEFNEMTPKSRKRDTLKRRIKLQRVTTT